MSSVKSDKIKRLAKFIILFFLIMTVFISYFEEYSLNRTGIEYSKPDMVEMTMDRKIEQTIDVACRGRLKYLDLYVTTYGRINHSKLFISLYDPYNKKHAVCEWEIECKQLLDNNYLSLPIEKQLNTQPYLLVITTDAIKGEGVGIGTGCADELKGVVEVNGKNFDNRSILYQLEYKISFSSFPKAAILMISFMVFVLGVIAFWLCRLVNKTSLGIHTFMGMWLLMSILFLIANPLFNVPDELNHFYRTCEIAEGHLISDFNSKGNYGGRALALPFDTDLSKLSYNWEVFAQYKDITLTDNMEFKSFSNTALYAPISYFPQAAGVALMRCFTNKIVAIAYAGRIINWLFVTLLFCIAYKITPLGKELIAFIALIPMNVQEAVSLAPDSMVVALTALIVAIVLNIRYSQKKKMSPGQILFIYFLGITVSLYKIVYLPFCTLFLLIPDEKMGGHHKKILHGTLLAMIVCSLSIVWMIFSSKFLTHIGANSSLQLKYVLRNPINFYVVLIRTIFKRGHILLMQMVGSSLAQLSVETSGLIAILLLVLLFKKASMRLQNEDHRAERQCFSIVFTIVFLLTALSLYLQWTPIYSDIIVGLQGRYYLPLLLPLFFTFSDRIYDNKELNSIGFDSLFYIALSNSCACISLLFANI